MVRWVRLWRTRNPVTFNEKVRYKLLRDRRPLLVDCADKARLRQLVVRRIGPAHLPRAHALLDDPGHLLDVSLPRQFVVKPTHGSGAGVLVSDHAPADARLPAPEWGWVYAHVRPEHAPREQLVKIATGWQRQLYGRGPNHEWAYGRAARRVLVEELLLADDGELAADHKVFVFHGRARFLQLDRARFGAHTCDFFEADGTPIDLTGAWPRSGAVLEPRTVHDLVRVAERLGQDTDFVRVDLYVVGGRILVGELSTSPAGGDSPFRPASWDLEFGATWQPPRRYR
jgi:hypothetical protein